MKKLISISVVFAVAAFAPTGCDVFPPTDTTDQFEVVRKAFDDYLSNGPSAAILAADVFEAMSDDAAPFILSVRAPEHFAIGHVPDAVNTPWRLVADLDMLDDLPDGERIVVYCYTGHTGAVATACLNAMGHEAVNMKYGMTAWTRDAEVRVAEPFSEETGNDFPTVTTVAPTETFTLPELDVTDSTDPAEIVRMAVKTYLDAGTSPIISAADLFDLLNDGDDSNDPFVISVRGPDDYAKGHIEGAINIPWKTIAKVENLEMIPPDADIVVYCYTGHTGGLATTVLNALGYNTRNMKFGMVAWTRDADIRVASAFRDDVDAHDYPVEP